MRELAGAVKALRDAAARQAPSDRELIPRIRDRVFAVAERLAEHTRVEEYQVYLWPEALLGGSQLDSLGNAMRGEVENIPPRFSVRRPH